MSDRPAATAARSGGLRDAARTHPGPGRASPARRDGFEKADQWREEIAAVIETLLPPDSDAGTVAVRPDPVGERLVLRELGSDPEFLRRCLTRANEEERLNACVSISRAAQADEQTADAMIAAVLPHQPDLWRQALAVVAAQGGPFTGALERLADRDDSPLPLAQLAETIPLGHVTLRDLALIATQRTRPPDPSTDTDAQARWRRGGTTSPTGSGDAGTAPARWPPSPRPSAIHRELAQDNPAAFLPDLAMSLNNLSTCQSATGDRGGALTSITEAVTHYQQLAQDNPAAFLPDLAMSLTNLSTCLSATGDRAGALASITEAVTHYRQLAQANPAAFLPNLALSLNNLSNRLGATGDRAGALASITEAVTHYQQLAQANPAAFLPDLAMSLNNLSGRQQETGDRAGALASITEAVTIYRQLARANPAAFLPDLALSLNNLSTCQSATGDRAGALTSITEAVTHYRQLAQANPAAFLPNLAMSLNNLSYCRSETGDRAGALDAITEAVSDPPAAGPGQPRRLPAQPRRLAE